MLKGGQGTDNLQVLWDVSKLEQCREDEHGPCARYKQQGSIATECKWGV